MKNKKLALAYVLFYKSFRGVAKDDEESPYKSDPFYRSDIFSLFSFSSFPESQESSIFNLDTARRVTTIHCPI